ncbi:MAG: c-type cytochrome [Vicinamibacterales bacterium]
MPKVPKVPAVPGVRKVPTPVNKAFSNLLVVLAVVVAAAGLLAQQNAQRNPFAGDSTAVAAGQRLFDQSCQACHGPGGRGDSGPALNTANFTRTDVDVFRTIQGGVAGSQMPPFRQLTDNELWQLVAYLRSLAAPTDPRRPLVVARTRQGREIRGVRLNEDTFTIQMMDSSGQLHLLDKPALADLSVETTLVLPTD